MNSSNFFHGCLKGPIELMPEIAYDQTAMDLPFTREEIAEVSQIYL
jgi:hypothetical protein